MVVPKKNSELLASIRGKPAQVIAACVPIEMALGSDGVQKIGEVLDAQVCHPPYGPWEHVPRHVWTDQSNLATTQDEAEDEAEVCVLCCQKRSTVTVCDECKEHYRTECIDTHTCGSNLVC